MTATMRAVVFHGPGDLRDEVLPVPEPARGEIVVRIDAALTCGTDVKVRRRGHPVMIPRVPTVFGHEFAGTVTAVGAGVSRVREGDRVAAANSAPCGECRPCLAQRPNLCEDLLFVNGAYGEYIALPPRLVAKNIVRLQRLTAARAAFAEPLACALLDRVRALGIGECLDASATADVVADLRAVTDGRGPDVTIDATGRPEVWEQAMAAVGRGGSVVFFGGCAPGTTVQVDTRRAHYEELTLVGAFHHTPELIRQAVDALETGTIVPDGLLTHRMRLDGVHAALDLMQKGEALKVLIEP